MLEIEKMAELATTTGYCSLGFLLGTSVAKRDRPYHRLLAAQGSWARALRKILDSRAGRKTRSPKNSSRQDKLETNSQRDRRDPSTASGSCEPPPPQPSSGPAPQIHLTFRLWPRSLLKLTCFLTTQRAEGPTMRKDPDGRPGARTPALNAGQHAPHFLRFTIAGEVADARGKFGGARIPELSVAEKMGLSR